ncbi:ATP-binding protein [Chryseobacterium sp.]|uniref:ATP-binding protein n=1 Tax=Chryseobacterium sp. TaxID=1871047 RepID=UPI000EBE5430|nr:ATP-binding protein [Chryseobacterium sp.]HCM35591.1 histidine kinase [Chryseobacterium sp.]
MLQVGCHEEQIHLCGKIQYFGYLFVFENDICIAASSNAVEITELSFDKILGITIGQLLNLIVDDGRFMIPEIEKHTSVPLKRFTERISIHNQEYYICIYQYDKKIFFEIEVCNDYVVKFTDLNNYAKELERSEDGWQTLTDLIKEITGFDRAMVYQFLEDNSGQVIAESKNEELSSFLSFRYPEFDIPIQARELYARFPARNVSNVDGRIFDILGVSADKLDLSYCSLRAFSPIHLQYLRNTNTYASASFSIIIEEKLWGLVTCQNIKPKHVDFEQRNLCAFLAQYAANCHLLENQKELITAHKIMAAVERDLKAELLLQYDFEDVLKKYAPKIMDIAAADGIVLKYNGELSRIGEAPDKNGIKIIDDSLLNKEEEGFFSTNQFNYLQSGYEDDTYFPGVIRISLLPENKWFLYLFRKENIVEEIWAGKPEKFFITPERSQVSYPSPRTSFESWKKMTKGAATNWKIRELAFLEKIAYVIRQAITQRAGEIFKLNRELIRANSALDTFGYILTHDLKNPLAMINLSADMILNREEDKSKLFNRLATNILNSTRLMTEMMDKVYELSQSTYIHFELEMINPERKIMDILENTKKQYESENLKFILGETIAIPGERTLLYQMFLNLIGNAVKYSSQEEYPLVEVKSYRKGLSVIYEIRDNGIGIDLSHGANIFEIFRRMPNTVGFEGAGIGLSIVKRIADRLGAKIFVESKMNIGTCFFIEFTNVPL